MQRILFNKTEQYFYVPEINDFLRIKTQNAIYANNSSIHRRSKIICFVFLKTLSIFAYPNIYTHAERKTT